jgi:hypothetical protein
MLCSSNPSSDSSTCYWQSSSCREISLWVCYTVRSSWVLIIWHPMMHLSVLAKTCIKWSWSNCHMQPGCNIVEALSTSRMKWYDLCIICIVNQMPGLKNEQKNLKWHLHELKISEAWDQFSSKRMTQIITLHCLCNPFHRLSVWHGFTSRKFYTV